MDLLYPPWLRTSSVRFDFVSNTEIARSVFSGATNSVERAGDRLRAKLTVSNASDRAVVAERSILKSLYAQLRGQANRIFICDPSYTCRGSFPAPELFSNSTFQSGTAGWLTEGAYALSASDRVMRMTRGAYDGGFAGTVAPYQSPTLAAYMPYVARGIVNFGQGQGGCALYNSASADGITRQNISSTLTASGLVTAIIVPLTAGVYSIGLVGQQTSGAMGTQDFYETSFVSLSRCALVDNGANLFPYSDQLDNAAWSKTRSSITANSTAAPDGTLTADTFIEDSSASNTHAISQTISVGSNAADYCLSFALKPNSRTWAFLQLYEFTGATIATAYFNLSTGAVGTVFAGANWSNLRTYTKALGNGWYHCSLIARKTNAAISLTAFLYLASGNGGVIYSGDGASNFYAWRGTLSQSSVPVRLAQTTGSALASGTAQSSKDIFLKGLPASTSGLLLPGDWVQLGTDLNMVVSSLSSDAMGLGYLRLYRPLRAAAADNDPVIINMPMGRFVATQASGGWDDSPGVFGNFEREFEESLDA